MTLSEVSWPFALDSEGRFVWIDNANREEDYFCPECNSKMIVVKGDETAHHFRHHVDANCGGEGPRHYFAKETLASALRKQRTEIESEWYEVLTEEGVGDYVVDIVEYLLDETSTYVGGEPIETNYYEIIDTNKLDNEKRTKLSKIKDSTLYEVDISKMSDGEIYDGFSLTTNFASKYCYNPVKFAGGSLYKHNNTWGVRINDYGEFEREDVQEGDYCVIYIKKSKSIRVVKLTKRILHNRNFSFFLYNEDDRVDLGRWWWED